MVTNIGINFQCKTYICLTFIGPCIANMFSEYNQQDATFLKFIYFCKTSACRPAAGSSNGLTNA